MPFLITYYYCLWLWWCVYAGGGSFEEQTETGSDDATESMTAADSNGITE